MLSLFLYIFCFYGYINVSITFGNKTLAKGLLLINYICAVCHRIPLTGIAEERAFTSETVISVRTVALLAVQRVIRSYTHIISSRKHRVGLIKKAT